MDSGMVPSGKGTGGPVLSPCPSFFPAASMQNSTCGLCLSVCVVTRGMSACFCETRQEQQGVQELVGGLQEESGECWSHLIRSKEGTVLGPCRPPQAFKSEKNAYLPQQLLGRKIGNQLQFLKAERICVAC